MFSSVFTVLLNDSSIQGNFEKWQNHVAFHLVACAGPPVWSALYAWLQKQVEPQNLTAGTVRNIRWLFGLSGPVFDQDSQVLAEARWSPIFFRTLSQRTFETALIQFKFPTLWPAPNVRISLVGLPCGGALSFWHGAFRLFFFSHTHSPSDC